MSKKRQAQLLQGVDVQMTLTEDYSALVKMVKAAKTANQRHIRFGWLTKAKYPNDERHKNLYVAQVAFWQEYGTHKIPARPYFRQLVNKVKRQFSQDIREFFIKVTQGVCDDAKLKYLANEIEYSFHSNVSRQHNAPLRRYTIEAKGNDSQWDETGRLLNSFKSQLFFKNIDNVKQRDVKLEDFLKYWKR